MRKINLLFAAALSMMAWTGTMAQTDAEYEAALAAIQDNGNYYVKSNVGGTYYYLTGSGTLTSTKANAGIFTFQKTDGGGYKTYGFQLNNSGTYFSNPPGTNESNLASGKINTSTSHRNTYETQVFFLKDGKYAIRACNTAPATSGWNWVGGSYWTVVGDVNPVAQYQWAANYCWELEGPVTVVNVTYKLVESDGTTQVSSTTVKQEANSAIADPLPGTGITYNGFFHEKFYYDYTVSGTIGDTDCTITITRTEKAGVVKALADLSNSKAYNIGCDRGAMIAYNGSMVSTALNNADANAQPYGKFALLKYEDNYYIFSIDENKFIKNDASVALDLTAAGFSTEDAMVMTAQTAPYFLWHFNATDKYLNTNGNQPLGYVINSYSTPDPGNLYYMVAVDDFDPTDALAELDAYFHPAYKVTYVVKDPDGNVLFTSEPQPAKAGAHITTLLSEFQRPFYTYNETDVEITELETTVEFTATWAGPFKLSTDFANAQWQNMAMRGTWYVTSGVKDSDGAYKTQNANTMGLVEDAYQWAFIGNGYDGFKIINKAAGDGNSFGWTDAEQKDGGIPTIMADGEGHHAWNVFASTNTTVPAGSFCLNVRGTNLSINQYGGAGGSVKFWNAAGNVSDPGSAFTVFDVPTNFASFVVTEIAPTLDATGYFTFTDAAKAALGYDESKKTDCTFAEYKAMKEGIPTAMADLNNFVLPETGLYLLKNKNYGTYMGIDPSDANMYGNYAAAKAAKQIVKLTKNADNTYTIGLMGKFAPATVSQSAQVTATADAANYTVVVPTVGYAAFQADPAVNMSVLHCAGGGSIVGWEAVAAASQWEVIDAEGVEIELAIGEEGYATTYLPFHVAIPNGVTAYTAEITENPGHNDFLTMNPLSGTIPELTAVVLKAAPATYQFKIGEGVAVPDGALGVYNEEVDGNEALVKSYAPEVENVLKGTLEPIDAVGKYVLAKPTGENVGFFKADSGTIAAGKAYLEVPAGSDVKAFYFLFPGDDATGINEVNAQWSMVNGQSIYNVAGQLLNKMQKGINIVNGKKILK